MSERDAAPADPLDAALACCGRHLGRRDHSVAELRARLVREAFPAAVIDDALAIVGEQGYLDDRRYARLMVEDRRAIDGWGVERIRARLEAAGIDRELIEEALESVDSAAELEAARTLVRRRCALPLAGNRERQRAFGLLVRQGFSSEIAYDAVRAASTPGAFEDS